VVSGERIEQCEFCFKSLKSEKFERNQPKENKLEIREACEMILPVFIVLGGRIDSEIFYLMHC